MRTSGLTLGLISVLRALRGAHAGQQPLPPQEAYGLGVGNKLPPNTHRHRPRADGPQEEGAWDFGEETAEMLRGRGVSHDFRIVQAPKEIKKV